ncbi:MAG: DUF192 domain-containing protein [Candidatus Pacebacteria bacterium]|nr:DUF192 domain-containing protein [Candidatus Paceibacterota bacterium]
MRSRVFFGAIILLAIIIFMGFWFKKNKMEITKICFGQNCFIAEIAKTQAQREKGLMFRENLASDGAMLFVFEKPGIYNFWMKNCLVPLDIIWLDENYKVVAIKDNCQPCQEGEQCLSIGPSFTNASAGEVKYVLEINAGLASKIGLSENSVFTLDK